MADSAFPKYAVGSRTAGIEFWLFVLLYVGLACVVAPALVILKRTARKEARLAPGDVRPENTRAADAVDEDSDSDDGNDDNTLIKPKGPVDQHQYPKPTSARFSAANEQGSARVSSASQRFRGTIRGGPLRPHEGDSGANCTDPVENNNPPVIEVSAPKVSGKDSVGTRSTNSGSHYASSASRTTADEADDVISELTGSIVPPASFSTKRNACWNENRNSGRPAGALRRMNSKTQTDHSSAIPSVATTSRLHGPSHGQNSRFVGTGSSRRLVFDNVGSRRSRRQSLRRIGALHHVGVHSSGSSLGEGNPAFSQPANASFTSRNSRPQTGITPMPQATASKINSSSRGLSDVASSILDDPTNSVDGPIFNRVHRRAMRRRFSSFSTSPSETSVLPSIIDDITPNDAADANDPGKGNLFDEGLMAELSSGGGSSALGSSTNGGYGVKLGAMSSTVENIFDLVDVDEQVVMLVGSSIPLTFMAIAEPLLRIVLVALIARFIGPEAMIAYLIVTLLLRLTNEEMAGSIVDALSSFVQACICSTEGDMAYLAGQYIQLGLVLQCLLGLPLLFVWTIAVYDVAFWLFQSDSIAYTAEIYAKSVVFKYLASGLGKTFGVLFQINDYESSEAWIDMGAQFVTALVVGCIVVLVEEASLQTIGYIQVLVEGAALFLKVCIPAFRGWITPLRRGMLCSIAPIQNHQAFFSLAFATLPLFAGAMIEYGEWELLAFCIRFVGPAEVSAWLALFSIWEVLEALTEGIGESSATIVASLLAISQPKLARRLSNKSLYLSFVFSSLVTGLFLMCGRPLLVLLTPDFVLQHLMHETLAFLGLANVAMSMLHLLWSVAGAQGRFQLATSAVFCSRWLVAMPAAVVCILAFRLDLVALSGCLVLGYTTATCILAVRVLGCDWDAVSKVVSELHAPSPVPPLSPLPPKVSDEVELPEDILEGFEDEGDDSSSDDSDDSSSYESESDDDESDDNTSRDSGTNDRTNKSEPAPEGDGGSEDGSDLRIRRPRKIVG